jgi:hypothetical protein
MLPLEFVDVAEGVLAVGDVEDPGGVTLLPSSSMWKAVMRDHQHYETGSAWCRPRCW